MLKERIFVAGGTGLVGANLVNELKKKNINYFASYYKKKIINKNYKFYNFENFSDCLKATKNIDTLFILAVKGSGILNLKKNFFSHLKSNFLIRYNLLEASRINKVKKILWISSSTVYQPSKKKIKEKNIDLNIEPYQIYKGTGWLYRYLEKLFLYYKEEYKMNIRILRTTSIYGPNDNFDQLYSHVVPALIRKALKKKKFIVLGDKKIVRDFVYVKDLVKALIMIKNSKKKFDIINFSSEKGITIQALSEKIAKLTNVKKIYFSIDKKNSSAPYRVLSNVFFNSVFKNFKRTSLDHGLAETIKWYKKKK